MNSRRFPADADFRDGRVSSAGPGDPGPGEVAGVSRAEYIRYALILAFFFAIFYFTSFREVRFTYIDSSSMNPTLLPGDHFVVMTAREYRRGDIVSFFAPRQPGDFVMKRIIGQPGDVIGVVEGRLYLNGEFILEPYTKEERIGYTHFPVPVPAGHFFVLGDNRNNSEDSSVWGFLPTSHIQGKVYYRYWPTRRVGRVGTALDEYFWERFE